MDNDQAVPPPKTKAPGSYTLKFLNDDPATCTVMSILVLTDDTSLEEPLPGWIPELVIFDDTDTEIGREDMQEFDDGVAPGPGTVRFTYKYNLREFDGMMGLQGDHRFESTGEWKQKQLGSIGLTNTNCPGT